MKMKRCLLLNANNYGFERGMVFECKKIDAYGDAYSHKQRDTVKMRSRRSELPWANIQWV